MTVQIKVTPFVAILGAFQAITFALFLSCTDYAPFTVDDLKDGGNSVRIGDACMHTVFYFFIFFLFFIFLTLFS
jgi:hypothetical protein